MKKLESEIRSLNNYAAISKYLPSDHSEIVSLSSYIEPHLNNLPRGTKILDLGCGEGGSFELFNRSGKSIKWHGVDIENSPEVKKRTRENDLILSFDGINLPYDDNYFDLIYCNQVLEHVRYIDALIPEAFRVLKSGGTFIGSVSYLEPFHSYSISNLTPYGVSQVFGDAGFNLKEIRPGVDALYLIIRQLLSPSKWLRLLLTHNYLYMFVGLISRLFRLEHRERNFLKVQFSGHLVFIAKRSTSNLADENEQMQN